MKLRRLRRALSAARLGPGAALTYGLARPFEAGPDALHLEETLAWLERAHDASGGRGVSCWYSPRGWHPDPYPETSGYILRTFLHAAQFGGARLADRALAIGEWELTVQQPSGGIPSSVRDPRVLRVFNTGQVVLGWCALADATGEVRWLEAGRRAARWLRTIQARDGSWPTDTHCGARTYDACVAWALLELASRTGEADFGRAAAAQIRWVLARQTPGGWFDACGFDPALPDTHTLGYTLRGLLECERLAAAAPGWDLDQDLREPLLRAARPLSVAMAATVSPLVPGLAAGAFDREWRPRLASSCLTGNAQLALVFFGLGEAALISRAHALIDATKRAQDVHARDPGIRGALAGSFPFDGAYCGGVFPNWAAKYLADALLYRLGGAAGPLPG